MSNPSSPALRLQSHYLRNGAEEISDLIDTDDVDPIAIGARLKHFADVVESAQLILVSDMRKAGASWAAVGEAMGISRQAAHERYS